jgi:hypothetical protein
MEVLNQIERIKSKLIIAKNTDKKLKVFGAFNHKYFLGKTVSEFQILEFEKDYDLKLPECYRSFLLHIGNGGISHSNSGAGPFYGIYSFGENIEELIYENTKQYLKEDCKLYPKMTNEFWYELTKNIEENDAISDEDFDAELGKIYSGILPLGTQGCSYYHALVLNGEFKGRVINVDYDRNKPRFTFELNFLDWYERWLDEVISGDLIIETPSWFGYEMGGLTADILEKYISATENETKIECLDGILNKQKISSEDINILELQYKISAGEIKEKLLQIITKFDYERAKPYLIDFTKESLLSVFQFVFWYAKDKSSDWLEIIEANAEKINNEETFRFCTYLLKEMNIDYGNFIVPFTSNESENIKISAYYSLGQLKNKSDYIDVFIVGLNDNSNRVIHSSLQALNGLIDRRLLSHYKMIAEKFTKEQDYILSNLNHNLKLFGLSTTTIKTINIDDYKIANVNEKKWFEFWK